MTDQDRKRTVPLAPGILPAAVWSAAVPIRFRHCDPAGIVFTPRYFDIFNEAVERFFEEALDLDYYRLIDERRLGLGYAQASAEFFVPNRMGERLDVGIVVDRIGRGSYTLVLPVLKAGREVARGRLVTVATCLDTGRACPLPDDVRTPLDAYRTRCGGWTVPA